MTSYGDEFTYDITTTTTISPDDIWTTIIYPQSDDEEARVEVQPIEVIRPENEVNKIKSDFVEVPQAKEIDRNNIHGKKAENHELENKYNRMQTENSENTENEIKALSAETSSNVLQMAAGNLDNKMLYLETHDQDSKTNFRCRCVMSGPRAEGHAR